MFLAVVPFATRLSAATTNEPAPNVVIILADDLGWADVSYHHRRAETPNIDRFVAESIELDRFTVAPMCSPTRAALMTGRYPIRFGLARAVIPPYRDYGLPPTEVTIAEALAELGYGSRAAFGKWHLGHRRAKWHPLQQGFTHFFGHYNGAIDYFSHQREGQRDWHYNWEASDAEGYTTDLIAEASAEWITDQAEQSEPYFCYVAFNAPHAPFQAKTADLRRYAELGGHMDQVDEDSTGRGRLSRATVRRALAAMIWRMDQGIGRILEAIEQTGEAENTVVWFFSDNGGISRLPNNNHPLRGDKLDVFEGGVRVPAAVRFPRRWPGGRKLDQPLNCIDILPTLVATAGGDLDDMFPVDQPLDGVDLSPLLANEVDYLPDRNFYYYHGQAGPDKEKLAITTPSWKLVVLGPRVDQQPSVEAIMQNNRVHLFQVPEDLREQRDLVESQPEIVRRLLAKVIDFRRLQPPHGIPPYSANRDPDFQPPENWQIPRPLGE